MGHEHTSAHNRKPHSTALAATIAVIALVIVSTFGFQMGKISARHSANPATETATARKSATVAKGETKSIGILQSISHPALDQIHQGIVDQLNAEGFVEGKNLTITYLNGEGDQSKLTTMSQKLVSKRPDAIIGIATPAMQTLANTTTSISLIMGAIGNPSKAGLVTDFKHPGGNITGVCNKIPAEQQFDLATTLLPHAKTVGMLYSSSEDNAKYQVNDATKIAEQHGLKVKKFAVPSSNEITQTVQVMSEQVDFIYVPNDNTIANAMPTVTQEANKHNTPIITAADTMVKQGGLATYAPSQHELGVRTGAITAKILRGQSKPADTPVDVDTSGNNIINTTQADLLGITIPDDLRTSATIVKGDQQ